MDFSKWIYLGFSRVILKIETREYSLIGLPIFAKKRKNLVEISKKKSCENPGCRFMTNEDFKIINEVLKQMSGEEKEELKSLLEVGIHWNVEVNDNSVLVSSDWSIHNTPF